MSINLVFPLLLDQKTSPYYLVSTHSHRHPNIMLTNYKTQALCLGSRNQILINSRCVNNCKKMQLQISDHMNTEGSGWFPEMAIGKSPQNHLIMQFWSTTARTIPHNLKQTNESEQERSSFLQHQPISRRRWQNGKVWLLLFENGNGHVPKEA
jgi:hypothetical protein